MTVATPDAPAVEKVGIQIAANKEAGAIGAGLAPEVQAKAKRLHVLVAEKKSRELLLQEATPFQHSSTFEKSGEQYLLSSTDANGDRKERTQAEKDKLTEVQATAKAFDDYLAKGYENVTAQATKDILRKNVGDYIRSNRVILEAIGHETWPAGNYDVDDATIDGILKDRKFANLLADHLNNVYDTKNLPTELNGKIIAAEARFKKAQDEAKKIGDAGGELDQAKRHASDTKQKKEDFDLDPSKGVLLATLEGHAHITEYKNALLHYENVSTRKGVRKEDLEAARQRVSDATNTNVQKYEELLAEQKGLYGKAHVAEAHEKALATKLTDLQTEQASAKAILDPLLLEQQQKSGEFSHNVLKAIDKVAQEHLVGQTKDFIDNYPQYVEEVNKALDDETADQLNEHVKERYVKAVRKKTFSGKEYIEYKTDTLKIRRDINLINEKGERGVDEYVDSVLYDAGITDPDKRRELMENKEFMDKQRVALVSRVLAAHIAEGGQKSIPKGIDSMLQHTQMGKEIWAHIVSSNPDAEKVAKLLTGGAEVSANAVDEIRKNKNGKKTLLAILLLALGAATLHAADEAARQALESQSKAA